MKKSEQNAFLRKITFDWSRRDFEGAFSGVEALVRKGTPEFRASAWLLGGMIKEDLGLLEDARSDWVSGLECSQPGTFTTYSLEYNIANSFERQGAIEETISWLRRSLITCTVGTGFSAEQALSDFCRLTQDKLSADDKSIVTAALEKSWRVLGLPGKPDTVDLEASVSILGQHFADIVAMARGETE